MQIKLGRCVLRYSQEDGLCFEYGEAGDIWEQFEKDLLRVRTMATVCIELEQLSQSGGPEIEIQV